MKKWLKKLISGEKTVIVAFGDSVTAGYFKSGTGEVHSELDEGAAYHQILGEKLRNIIPNSKLEVINAGVGGDSANTAKKRLQQDVLNKKPDLVTVCFGLNDVNGSVKTYKNSLAEIFTRIKEIGADILFLTPNMLNTTVSPDTVDGLIDYANKTAGFQNDGTMDEFMDAARGVAAEFRIPVCDCYKKWKALSKMGVDTVALLDNRINHPTRAMHEFFAENLLDTLLFCD